MESKPASKLGLDGHFASGAGAIEQLKSSDTYRSLRQFAGIDFSSNDFLNLSQHPKIKQASINAIRQLGNSASASRLVTGNSSLHASLEKSLAAFMGQESALLFSTGYMANTHIIDCLPKGTKVYIDHACHASIYDGLRLSGFRFKRYRHNDLEHLVELLEKESESSGDESQPRFIITESIFSMDGDRADLKRLVEIKKSFNAWLMVDEAHAIGLLGDNLSGLACLEGVQAEIDILVGTFGKGVGGFGAFFAGKESFKAWLINKARGFIFTTALPPSVVAGVEQGIKLMPELSARAKRVLKRSDEFRRRLAKAGISTLDSSSHIIPVVLGENSAALKMAEALQESGFTVLAMRPPTVPVGSARLRVVIHYHQKRSDVMRLADLIIEMFPRFTQQAKV